MKVQEKTISVNGEYYLDFEEVKEEPSNFKHLAFIFALLFSVRLGTNTAVPTNEIIVDKVKHHEITITCSLGEFKDRLNTIKYGDIPDHLQTESIRGIIDDLEECLN